MRLVNHKEEFSEVRKPDLAKLSQLKGNKWSRRILTMIKTTSVKKKLTTKNTFGTNIGDIKSLKNQHKLCLEKQSKLQQLEQVFILLKIKKKANGLQQMTTNSTIFVQ